MGLEMFGLDSEERLVVDLRQIIMTQLGMTESTEEQSSQIFLIETEHVAILLYGIFPLFEIDIGLALQQPQIDVLGVLVDGINENRNGVAPLLGSWRLRK